MTRYFEFYGLPAAGKSTLIEPLIQQLRDRGYKVIGPWEDVVYRNKRTKSRLLFLGALFHFSEYKIFLLYWKVFRKCSVQEKHYFKRLIIFVHQLIMIFKSGDYDIIICDEGIIQFTSSLYFLEDVTDVSTINKIVNELQKIMIINPICCSIDVNESLRRMKNRPYGQNRRYSYSRDLSVLEKAMKHRENNLKVISSAFPEPLMVDMNQCVEKNVGILLNWICK